MAPLVAALCGLLASACSDDEEKLPQVPPGTPNVIVVMTDDETVRDMSVMTYTRDLFARRGVEFSNSISSFPLCCPSRVTFMTGQLAHNHGIESNKEKEGGGYANYDPSGSVPVTLERSGYRTGFVGKFLNGYDVEDVPEGWSSWAGKKGGLFDYTLNVDGKLEKAGDKPGEYQTDVTSRLAAQFVTQSAEERRPFFLWASYQAPHGESGKRGINPRPAPRHRGDLARRKFPKPPSYDERDVSDKPSFVRDTKPLSEERRRNLERRTRARRASLLAVDEGVEQIVEAVRDAGVARNTYIFFISDNGYMFGEHRQTAKTQLYEESLRVPLLALGPRIPAGEVRNQPVANADMAATIYQIAGVEPGREQDGTSLLAPARRPRAGADRDILIENQRSVGVRAPGWVYIEHEVDDGLEYELYDLGRDPWELQNLVETESGELRAPSPRAERELERLRSRLEVLRDCHGDSCL